MLDHVPQLTATVETLSGERSYLRARWSAGQDR
jgi:hypothetical protein